MADQQQLDLLHQGVEAWNTWKDQHPFIHLDLIGADLIGAELSRAKLYGADLHGAGFNYTTLIGADLHGADLNYANLTDAHLNYANLASFTTVALVSSARIMPTRAKKAAS